MTITEKLSPVAQIEAGPNAVPLPAHVTDFMLAVEQAADPNNATFVMSEVSEDMLPGGKTPRITLQGLHLDALAFDFLSSEGQLPPRFDFTLDRARGFNAKRSAHQVFFGDITYQDLPTNESRVQPVAVKKFERGHNKAIHEYMQLKALAARGFTVFIPAGILVTDHAEYLITHYEDGLSTLDNENWAYMQSDQFERSLMEQRLIDTADELAELQVKARTFHGDAKTRNIAKTIDGTTRLIDFESAETIDDTTSWLAAFKKKAGADIISLYKSLEENRGLFDMKKKTGLNGGERHDIFRELFVNNYILAVAEEAAELSNDERKQLADALHGIQDDVYFAVFKDWDKRRIPSAKRDPKSLDPHQLLGVSDDPGVDATVVANAFNGPDAASSARSMKRQANALRRTRRSNADLQAAQTVARIARRALSQV